MEQKDGFELIVTVVNHGFSDYVIATAKASGASGATIFNARGTGVHEQDVLLGVNIQPEKEVILIIVPKEDKKRIMTKICEQSALNEPGKGICFSIPVSSVAGVSHLLKEMNEKE